VFCTRISQYQIWNTAHLTSTPINQSINPVRELKLDKGGFFIRICYNLRIQVGHYALQYLVFQFG
jgi:hypothetical protein